MKEMLLVGRGGEGVVLASQILADTLARAGGWVQSFPEFKAERRGAPISAFLRWDEDEPIHRHWKLAQCDVLAVVSPSPPTPQALASVRPGGLVVLNRETRFAQSGDFHVARVPASRIAQEHGVVSSEGRPMGNMALLGALVRLLVPDALPHLEAALVARMGDRSAPNVAAARKGYTRATRQHARADDAPAEPPPAPKPWLAPLWPVSTTDSRALATGSWSLDRPRLTEHCTACALCALFCPEGVISRNGDGMAIDLLHCKGCGICEDVCPVKDAVVMEEVPA